MKYLTNWIKKTFTLSVAELTCVSVVLIDATYNCIASCMDGANEDTEAGLNQFELIWEAGNKLCEGVGKIGKLPTPKKSK